MKNTKRLVALLLALIMILSCAPVSIFAEGSTQAEFDFSPVTPVTEAFVSEQHPTITADKLDGLRVNGGVKENVTLLTFETSGLNGKLIDELSFNVKNDAAVYADVLLVKDYQVNAATLNYNGLNITEADGNITVTVDGTPYSATVLENDKVLVKGENTVDFSRVDLSTVGDYFTVIIRADATKEAGVHSYFQDFEGFEASTTKISSTRLHGASDLIAEGYVADEFAYDAGGSSAGTYYYSADPSNSDNIVFHNVSAKGGTSYRNIFFNSISYYGIVKKVGEGDTATTQILTGEKGDIDINGKTYRFSLDMLTPKDLTFGVSSTITTTGYAVDKTDSTYDAILVNLREGYKQVKASKNWQNVSVDYTINPDHVEQVISEKTTYPIFAFRYNNEKEARDYYFDNLSVVELTAADDADYPSKERAALLDAAGIKLIQPSAAPIADTYVSADDVPTEEVAEDTTVHGSDETMTLAGGNVALLTYVVDKFNDDKVEINLPITEGIVTADIHLIDGLSVADVENTLTYTAYNTSYASQLTDDNKLGRYDLTVGDNYIDITEKAKALKNSYFTLVIKTVGSAGSYEYDAFEKLPTYDANTEVEQSDYFHFDTVPTDSTEVATPTNAYYKVFSETDKSIGSLTTTLTEVKYSKKYEGCSFNISTANTKLRLFNTISDQPLKVENDRILKYNPTTQNFDTDITNWNYTFTVKWHLNVNSTTRYMYLIVSSSDGKTTHVQSDEFSSSDTTAKTIKLNYQLDTSHLTVGSDGSVTDAPMFGFNLCSGTRYIISATVTATAPTATLGSKEGAAYNAPYIKTSNAGDLVADTYVSGANPDAAFGTSNQLLLNGGDNEHIILATFMSKTLNKDAFISLPVANQSLVNAEVYLIDGYRVNERALSHNNRPELSKNELLGSYTFTGGENQIDLSEATVNGDYFTIAIKSTDADAYVPLTQSFDSLEADKELDFSNAPPAGEATDGVTPYYSYTTSDQDVYKYLGKRRGNLGDGYTRALSDGNTVAEIDTAEKGYLVFYNSVSRHDVTTDGNSVTTLNDNGDIVDITGKKLRITADATSTNGTCNIRYMAHYAMGGAPIWLGERTKANSSSDTYDIRLNSSNSYKATLSYDYDINAADVNIAYTKSGVAYSVDPMLGFHFNTASRLINLDNVRVCEVVDGNEVQAVVAKGSISLDSGNLIDGKTVIIRATVASDASGNVITIVNGDNNLVLLRAEKGNLIIDKTNNVLCDGNGDAFDLTKGALDVVAIYDDVNGTVRFAVGNMLAYYYVNGETLTASCDHVVGGVGDTAYVAGNLNVKRIKDVPQILGAQTHTLDAAVRFVSGVDSIYYNSVGFEITAASKGTTAEAKAISTTTIVSSIIADDKTVHAEDFGGYNYFNALAVTDITAGDIVKVVPYAKIGTKVVRGTAAYYSITLDGSAVLGYSDENAFVKAQANAGTTAEPEA